jgi:hypothetical protein
MRTNLTPAAILMLIVAATAASTTENTDPDGDGSQYAYGENVGWLSLSCKNTLSCGDHEYGVRNDGHGVLSGFAWSENAGWISFAPYSAGVSIDPTTGVYSGHAWGENAGWVSFVSTGTNPHRIKTDWACDPLPAPPAGSSVLLLGGSGSGTVLEWSPVVGEAGYDVVFGELAPLRTSSAPFVAATLGCLAENRTTNSLTFSADPAANEGWWFLVRGANCGGNGTQDTGEPSQVAPRDLGIDSSGNDCI